MHLSAIPMTTSINTNIIKEKKEKKIPEVSKHTEFTTTDLTYYLTDLITQ